MKTRRRRIGVVVPAVLAIVFAACGGSENRPSVPTAPSMPAPPPTPSPTPSPTRFALSGVVIDDASKRPVAGARIEIVEGPNQGHSATTDGEGRYRITELEPGTFSLRATADDMEPGVRTVTLSADQAVDFALHRKTAPPVPFHGLVGKVLDGLSEAALGLVSVQVDGLADVTTSADGTFRVEAPDPEQQRVVRLSSSVVVEHSTHLRIPGPEATLTLIPASFDLRAFDEMFRHSGGLHRWTSAPGVVIQTRVLQFTNVSDAEYTATSATAIADSEIVDLLRDLTSGLQQLTANRFVGFAGERVERATSGERVQVARAGQIVVARYEGLQTATGYWGYGRWASDGQGAIHGGIVMLDRAFDTSTSQYRRSLHIHELGHALGYAHVTGRPSTMNASATVEPNDFDRAGAKLAFQRPPWNRTPDIDPDPFTSNLRVFGGLVWSVGLP